MPTALEVIVVDCTGIRVETNPLSELISKCSLNRFSLPLLTVFRKVIQWKQSGINALMQRT